MKIFLIFLAFVSCSVLHVSSLGHIKSELESWNTNTLSLKQNQNVRNPLLLGSSTSLNVLDKLQNIRNKIGEIEKKNTNLPITSPVSGHENKLKSINSFINDLSLTNYNKGRSNAFDIRPLSMLEKIPVMPSSLNGYFMLFRMKQNVSNAVPTKSQTRFIGNEQQHYLQQISAQKPETVVSKKLPFGLQTQVTSQQQSLNNQQMNVRRFNIQDHSSNHGSQQIVGQQKNLANNGGHYFDEQQRINQRLNVNDQRSGVHSQQFSRNERRSQDNVPRPIASDETSINQHFSVRNLQQEPASRTQQTTGQQGILSINRQSTISQYIRPHEITLERIVSNVPITENPTKVTNNFEYPSSQQIQTFADKLLTKIQSSALRGESQPFFIDNLNRRVQSTSHQAPQLIDLERIPEVPVEAAVNVGQISRLARQPTGASVKQHLKTPYANYDFSHLL